MKKRSLLVLPVCLILMLSACDQPAASPRSPTPTPWWVSPTPGPDDLTPSDTDDRVVFSVGEESVYFSEFYFFYNMSVYSYYSNYGPDSGLNLSNAGSGQALSDTLKQQNYPGSEMSWDDVFMESTKEDMHRALAMYQQAKAEGYTMQQWEKDNIQGFFDTLDEYSQQQSIGKDELLQQQYGAGLTVARVEAFLQRYWMGVGFESNNATSTTYTDAELTSYYNEHKEDATDIPDCTAVSVRHILITNKQSAQDTLERFEATDRSEEAFSDLAKVYTEDAASQENGGLYIDMTPQNAPDSFSDVEKWMFDSARQPGNYELISFEGGNQLVYFVAKGDPLWKLWSRARMLEAYATQIMERYPFTYPE